MTTSSLCLIGCYIPTSPDVAQDQVSSELKADEVLIEYIAHSNFLLHHGDHRSYFIIRSLCG